ncbi:hypothetical protein GmHk_01G002460 [Glycine max]|nr:hypothetical protein GmHk_01G002460 [Glycine max]
MVDVELSAAREDRLETAMAKLAAAQLRLESTLDALLLKLPSRTSHHYLPSSSVQSPPSPMPPLPPMLTPPPLLALIQSRPTPLPTPLSMSTPSPMLTPLPMPTPPPLSALIQSRPTPLSALLLIVVVPLLANSNPNASSDHRWITIFQVRKEYPNHYKELNHSFLFYATIDTTKCLDFHNTNLHSLIPSLI